MPQVRISVRALVEFILRAGDLHPETGGAQKKEAMLLGQKVHRRIQKSAGGDYESEVSLYEDFAFDDLTLRIEGRADGVFTGERRTVDEIKGMYRDPGYLEEAVPLHLSQAKCYAAILLQKEALNEVDVRITYVHFRSGRQRYFIETYQAEELRDWFRSLAEAYHKWAAFRLAWQKIRNESIEALSFPFPYRKGQKELVSAVYHSMTAGEQLFLMAPTGVGKTLAVLYPAIQMLRREETERLFYLTAKNQTKAVAEEAVEILMRQGLRLKAVTLTAREKICPMLKADCDPEHCPYAKGHNDRINDALYELLTAKDKYDSGVILRHAQLTCVCPFELGKELTSFCDLIDGDYNYAFDPNARLRSFFGEGAASDSILLIDEAHNLVERARMMFSAELVKEEVLAAKRLLPEKEKGAVKALSKLNRELLALKKQCEAPRVFPAIDHLAFAVLSALSEIEELFAEEDFVIPEGLLDFSFSLRDFAVTQERMGEDYRIYGELDADGHFHLRLFCIDPARLLAETFSECRASVLFSATLLPVRFYEQLLGLPKPELRKAIYAPSPFDPKKRKVVIVKDVSTRYRQRGREMYRKIARAIFETARSQSGNYMAFFPSYRFLSDVLAIYRDEFDCPKINWVAQSRYMDETDREIFLENFDTGSDHSLIAFCVMGGAFAEGIDLSGERLIGSMIVGCGLPQVAFDTELLRSFFDETENKGYAYAYLYPGMNKVLQAAGRVIRTEHDRGAVILLDDRFLQRETQALFPREWGTPAVCDAEEVGTVLSEFWQDGHL